MYCTYYTRGTIFIACFYYTEYKVHEYADVCCLYSPKCYTRCEVRRIYIYMQICHTIHVVRMYVRPSAKPRFSRLCVFRKASAFFRFCDSMADSNYYSHVHTEKARKGQVLRIQPSKIRNTGRKKKAARTHPSFQAKEARKTKQEASAPSSM